MSKSFKVLFLKDHMLHSVFHSKYVLFNLNKIHGNFCSIFFEQFRSLLEENDESFVCHLTDYIRRILSHYMFIRVERPYGSKKFVLGYVKCERVFSFAIRFEQMRLRLNRVPPMLLTKVESEENKKLRLVYVGDTNYERAIALHSNTRVGFEDTLLTPLGSAFYSNDEESVEALLDGGHDPNEVDGDGWNALHRASLKAKYSPKERTWISSNKGCSLPLFHRILGMIHNVNAVTDKGYTALIYATAWNHLDIVNVLMNHPGIDVNVQDQDNSTALHRAVEMNYPIILAKLLSDDRVDTSLKDKYNYTPLGYSIDIGRYKCVKILREHGAPEE